MISDQLVREQVLDVTKSFLVQAPAGSGKTSLLVQRFLCTLAVAKHGPEEILAITFTRKAAAEMRDRILNALELGLQQQDPITSYEHNLWTLARKVLQRDQAQGWNLLQNPARLKIQTIDALCASITKQMPILSRFGSQPLIEPEATQLYNHAVEQLLQTLGQDHYWHDALMYLLGYLDNDRLKVKRLLLEMLRMRDQWLPTLVRHNAMSDLRGELEAGLELAVAETMEHLLTAVPSILNFDLLPCCEPQDLDDWLQNAAVLLTATDEWRKTVTAKEGFAPPSKAKDKAERALLQERKDTMLAMLERLQAYPAFKQQLIAIRNLPPIIYNDMQWAIVDALTLVLPVLAAQLTVVFRDQGKVDFVEVALAAISALQSDQAPSDLALALDCKIQHILVDEFQDTSQTQYRLLERLTASWDAHDQRTLFLVGDPMQSIYRFRQAEVGLYLKAKQHGINNVKLHFVQLTTNFRSSPQVMAWINNVFAHSFPVADDMTLGAISYMVAHAADESVIPAIHDAVIPGGYEAVIPDIRQAVIPAQRRPGRAVAGISSPNNAVQCFNADASTEPSKIIEIIQNHHKQDPNQSIAILVRAKKHLLNILPALRQHHIAFQGVEIESLRERPLIQDLLALTKALLHLDDRIAWLAILRAPWCGLTLQELQLLAATHTTIWDALQQNVFTHRTARFKAIMHNALQQLGRTPLVLLAQNTWEALGGKQCLQNEQDHEEAAAFFNLLVALNNQRELFNPDFLAQQLEHLFLPATNVQRQAVQVMTMHKAKGLEFDVVIIPGLAKSIKNDDPQLLLIDPRYYEHEYLLIAAIRAANQQEDAIYDYLYWCEQQRQEHESLRLLYVAATRARAQIYCLADVNEAPSAATLLSKIWPVVAEQFIAVTSDAATTPTQPTRMLQRLPDAWYDANPYHAQNINTIQVKHTPWQADWLRMAGIVMHRTLWQIASEGITNWNLQRLQQQQEIWRQHLRQLGLGQRYQQQAQKIIYEAISNALQDPFCATVLSAQHAESYTEWRLTRCDVDQVEHMVLDRVFVDDDIVWLVDYKLIQDLADLDKAVHSYKVQINKYVQALQILKPKQKIIAGLYFPLQSHWQVIYS